MKTGRNLQEVLVELNRQNKAKQDFISPAQGMRLREDGRTSYDMGEVKCKLKENSDGYRFIIEND